MLTTSGQETGQSLKLRQTWLKLTILLEMEASDTRARSTPATTRVLGILLDPLTDQLRMPLRANHLGKCKGKKMGPDLDLLEAGNSCQKRSPNMLFGV